MGYYTEYTISAVNAPEREDEFQDALEAITGFHMDFDWNDRCKWYSHQEHMKELSLLYPDVLFKLEGEGEESGDLWIMYFQNGKQQICRATITYEDFDESKLE